MEKWLLIVETDCKDDKRDSEFNNWYKTIHIPDILSDSPGFKSGARYLIKDPVRDKGKYLAIFEIETNDIKKTMEAHSTNMKNKKAADRWTDLLEIVSRRICKVEDL
jgi:hypothetical protein